METVTVRAARRLALARAGLLKPGWTGMPRRAAGRGRRARSAAQAVIERFGYLQLDTVSVAGARTHGIVLLSRIENLEPALAEQLLQPGGPLFEYWGHEACWIPLALYPAFAFRRADYRLHPWYGDVLGEHPELVRELLRRVESEGPIRSVDLESGGGGWWRMKPIKRVALALWSSGDLAIRERRSFQRLFDLAERVIPAELRGRPLERDEGIRVLLERALAGHGWATTGTLAATWRLKSGGGEVREAMDGLVEAGIAQPCALVREGGKRVAGWIRPADLELAARLETARPRRDRGVLLSPFDPVLWDRARVQQLFGFEQVLEIYKPAPQRRYGYYCLPVLAGDSLVARVDLKALRAEGKLQVLSCHYEAGAPSVRDREAVDSALARYSGALGLDGVGCARSADR